MHVEFLFVILFSVATAVALSARWLKIPYTVALVLAGLAIGASHTLEAPHLTKEFLFAVILPGLIFEAAFHLNVREFWNERFAIHSLAIPGLAVAVLLTAVILAPVVNVLEFVGVFTIVHAMVFASLIVATDPIAVVGLFKTLGAPRRLAVLVEGESLLNDGTGIVLFTVVVAGVAQGHIAAGSAVFDFLRIAGIGALLGAAIGYAVSQIIRQIDDPMVELTLTIIAANGSFIVAEHFHVSGVIATVLAGMLCGNYGARVGMSPTTRVAVETAWEYLAFALNSIVFLLIGLEIQLESLLAVWKPIVVAYLAVMVARAVIVFAVSGLLRRTRGRIPWSWSAAVTWAGLRGALSMVLVLSLAADFPHRDLLLNMTYGVVVLSILLQGLTMGPLLRWLGIAGVSTAIQESHELERGWLQAANAAIGEIEQMRQERSTSATLLDVLHTEYSKRVETAEAGIRKLHLESDALREEGMRAARRRLLVAERDAVLQAAHKGLVGANGLEKLLADIDMRREDLDAASDSRDPNTTKGEEGNVHSGEGG